MGTPRSLISVHHQSDPLTYETFFGLTEKAFSLNSDPRFLYHSPSHAATFENLLAGIRRREGLLVLTGEIGTGKTMLCRAVLRNLGRQTYSSFVPDPFVSREDLLKMLLIDFGVMSIEDFTTGSSRQASRTELSYLLAGFLDSLPPLDAFVVVIIDEAQNMSLPLIEEVRILADSFGSKGHLQIVFVGQPELHAKLQLPEMRQVDQRVCSYNRLAPLGRDAVAGYVEHRLHVAGLSRERVLFSPEVIDNLYRRSGGVPRLINRICDRALHVAHQRQAACVDLETLERALNDVGATTLTPTWASIVAPETEVVERPRSPLATPVPAAEAPAAETPAAKAGARAAIVDILDDDQFSTLVDDWVTQDLAPDPRTLTRQSFAPETMDLLDGMTSKRPTPLPSAARPLVERRKSSEARPLVERRKRSTQADRQGKLRSETYLQRLNRVWAKRVAVAVVCLAAVTAAVLGASALSDVMSPPALPALPTPPARAVFNIVPPALPSSATSQPAASQPAASQPESAGDYLIAVGLFADRVRADRLVEELTQAGLRAGLRPFQLGNQLVQQVVLGPFANRADAVEDMQRLRRLGGHDDANVVRAAREPG